jgi:hypothetical protein
MLGYEARSEAVTEPNAVRPVYHRERHRGRWHHEGGAGAVLCADAAIGLAIRARLRCLAVMMVRGPVVVIRLHVRRRILVRDGTQADGDCRDRAQRYQRDHDQDHQKFQPSFHSEANANTKVAKNNVTNCYKTKSMRRSSLTGYS